LLFLQFKPSTKLSGNFGSSVNLYCHTNKLTKLPKLPDVLRYLECDENKLTKLPELTEGLKSLYCGDNQLTSLPKLPESLTHIDCYNNNLPYEVTLENLKEHNTLLKRKNILSKICV